MKYRKWLGWMLVALLSGCTTWPGTTTDTVNGRQVESVVAGQGRPVVVFEHGLGGTFDGWAKVWPEAANETTSLAYNRAGYGRSDAAGAVRDGTHAVEELRQLLQARQLPPPYILVGHSLGGLYMQLFARRYPHEVAALVLVDSTHPDQLKGAGNPESWPIWLKLAFGWLTSEVAKQELAGLDATGQAVLSLPVDPAIPVFVLSALKPMQVSSVMADDANRKRADLANLYPNAQQIWVDSGHVIPLEKPDAVIQAIREAVRTARRF